MNESGNPSDVEKIELDLFLRAIDRRYGYDFSGYAAPSLFRRVQVAQRKFGCPSISVLQHKILREPELLPELIDCLTIQVSEMFRDPDYFKALRDEVVPHLRTYPSLKVWVAGCGRGEELYSLAILFREEGLEARTLFYATDINPMALAAAERGIYSLERMALFTQNHQRSGASCSLADYYSAGYGAAVFDRSLRSRVVFSQHSLVSDHVFSEVHLISCRNVLIYFTRELQERAVGLFEDSLSHGGFLGLGSRESLRFMRKAAAFVPFLDDQKIHRRSLPNVAAEVKKYVRA